MFYLWDPTLILVIPALILALWAQVKVKRTYAKYSDVPVRSGLTGAQAAEAILSDAGIRLAGDPGAYPEGQACGLNSIPGELNDHYDPRSRTLNLSQPIYSGRNVAALGVAAHEAGHAIQHARSYAPLQLRNVIYPVCNFGSFLAFPLFFIGFLARVGPLMNAAILLFSFAVFFTVLTLPVELNASRRALRSLQSGAYLTKDELAGAKSVLTAAAMTYVASTAMAILQLVRMLILSRD